MISKQVLYHLLSFANTYTRQWQQQSTRSGKLAKLVFTLLLNRNILREANLGFIVSYIFPILAVIYPSFIRLFLVCMNFTLFLLKNRVLTSTLSHFLFILFGLLVFKATLNDQSRGKSLVLVNNDHPNSRQNEVPSVHNLGKMFTLDFDVRCHRIITLLSTLALTGPDPQEDSKFYRTARRLHDTKTAKLNLPSAYGDIIYEWLSCPSTAKTVLLEERTKDFGDDDYWIPQLNIHSAQKRKFNWKTIDELDAEYCHFIQYDKPKLLSVNLHNPTTEMFCIRFMTTNVSASSFEVSRMIKATVEYSNKLSVSGHVLKTAKLVTYSMGGSLLMYQYLGPVWDSIGHVMCHGYNVHDEHKMIEDAHSAMVRADDSLGLV
jgi:hypothetical protein